MKTRARTTEITLLQIFSGDLWAGAEKMIFNLLKQLKDYPNLRIIALSLNEGTLSESLQENGIETLVIPETHNSFSKLFFKALHSLKGRGIHIIHSHRYKENILAVLLARSIGVRRLVSTVHGLSELPTEARNGGAPLTLKDKIDYWILKQAFTRTVAVSHDMKQVLVQRHGFSDAKVEVIFNGIEIPDTPSAPDHPAVKRDFHIGSVGRMVAVKDFDLFLEVAAEISRRLENVRFSILGDGLQKDRLLRKASDLKLDGKLQIETPRPDPFPYLRSIDIYLNTSRCEGLPLSILEAMACGKPVVAPRVGGVPEIISDGKEGLLADERTQRKLADLCMQLLRNDALRIVMGQNGQEKVQRSFSNLGMAQAYSVLYLSLMFPA